MGSFRAWINGMRWIVEKGHCPGSIGTVYRKAVVKAGQSRECVIILSGRMIVILMIGGTLSL